MSESPRSAHVGLFSFCALASAAAAVTLLFGLHQMQQDQQSPAGSGGRIEDSPFAAPGQSAQLAGTSSADLGRRHGCKIPPCRERASAALVDIRRAPTDAYRAVKDWFAPRAVGTEKHHAAHNSSSSPRARSPPQLVSDAASDDDQASSGLHGGSVTSSNHGSSNNSSECMYGLGLSGQCLGAFDSLPEVLDAVNAPRRAIVSLLPTRHHVAAALTLAYTLRKSGNALPLVLFHMAHDLPPRAVQDVLTRAGWDLRPLERLEPFANVPPHYQDACAAPNYFMSCACNE